MYRYHLFDCYGHILTIEATRRSKAIFTFVTRYFQKSKIRIPSVTLALLYAAIFLCRFAVIPRNEESISDEYELTDPSLAFRMTDKHKKYIRYYQV